MTSSCFTSYPGTQYIACYNFPKQYTDSPKNKKTKIKPPVHSTSRKLKSVLWSMAQTNLYPPLPNHANTTIHSHPTPHPQPPCSLPPTFHNRSPHKHHLPRYHPAKKPRKPPPPVRPTPKSHNHNAQIPLQYFQKNPTCFTNFFFRHTIHPPDSTIASHRRPITLKSIRINGSITRLIPFAQQKVIDNT